ncbi:MAG TPA: hypothetical protein VGB83_06230 [Actinomycetota bacterium]
MGIGVSALVALTLTPPAAQAFKLCSPQAFTLHVSPAGSDSNSGLSILAPLRTLKRANELLHQYEPATDAHIRIDPASGDFVYNGSESGENTWTYFNPAHDTVFLPYGPDLCDLTDGRWSGTRPVFRGSGANRPGFWFYFNASGLGLQGDVDTRLKFMGLEVTNFGKGGVSLQGASFNQYHANRNGFHNMDFVNIGKKFDPGVSNGYGAIVLKLSSHNIVSYSSFDEIINTGTVPSDDPDDPGAPAAGHVHVLYLQHDSNANWFHHNRATDVSGDPIKFRDGSDYNAVEFSFFNRAGLNATSQDYFHPNTPEWQAEGKVECTSVGNVLADNITIVSGMRRGFDGQAINLRYFFGRGPEDDRPDCGTAASLTNDDRIDLISNDSGTNDGPGW